MEIFPAIDIKDGNAVRLEKGDYSKATVYSKNLELVAESFKEQGARNLHMVDLNGAKEGKRVHSAAISRIADRYGLFIQLGGGIRDEESIKAYLDMGINRVILGTVALEDFNFTEKMIHKYGERIAVSVDAVNGKVAVKGWQDISGTDSLSFCKKLDSIGLSTLVYTDISKDGMNQGTNLEIYKTLSQEVQCNVIASGGVCSYEEIKVLKEMKLYGAIVGKAIYEGLIDLSEVLEIAD